jgi:ATP synthase protein I
MNKFGKRPGLDVFAGLAMVGQLGFAVAVPIVLGVVVGNRLDKWLDAHGLILVALILLGVAGGVYSAYRLLAGAISDKRKDKDSHENTSKHFP